MAKIRGKVIGNPTVTPMNIPGYVEKIAGSTNIISEAQGSLISLPDSAEAQIPSMRIFGKSEQLTTTGKNKFDANAVYGEYKQADGSFSTTSGVANGIRNYFGEDMIGKAVTITAMLKKLDSNQNYIALRIGKSDGSFVKGKEITNNNVFEKTSLTFTVSSKDDYWQITYGNTATAVIEFKDVLVSEDTDTTWEPYTGGMPSPNPNYPQEIKSVGDDGSVEQFVKGKQLLLYPYKDTTKTISGITFTDNGDGSVTANGTATSTVYFKLNDGMYLAKGNYILSGCPTGGGDSKYRIYGYATTSYLADFGKGSAFTVTEDMMSQAFYISITSGATVSNLTFKPMLRLANTDDTYEPYKSQSLTIPTPNGLPGVPVSSGGNYTDENGQQYVSDYKDYERMVYVQRVGETAVTFKSTNVLSSGNRYGICVLSDKIAKSAFGGVSEKAVFRKGTSSTTPNEFYENSTNFVFVGSTDDTDETIRAKFEGSKLFYVLETPIETPLSEEEIAAYKALHTNYPNTTIYNDDGAYTEVKYVADTKNYVDNKIATEVAKLTAAIIPE